MDVSGYENTFYLHLVCEIHIYYDGKEENARMAEDFDARFSNFSIDNLNLIMNCFLRGVGAKIMVLVFITISELFSFLFTYIDVVRF